MRRYLVAFSALGLAGLGLAGCGLQRFEQREAWRGQAELACLQAGLVRETAYTSLGPALQGPGTCGMDHAIRVTAFADGEVALSQRATLACPIIPQIDAWLAEVVQPAASLHFGARVVEVRSGSYACRSRNNQRGARMSEHGYGNAVDIHAFRLSDGREVTLVRGWHGRPEEQDFLREVFLGACRHFTTVLGPGADPFHYDHFHFDLARHDPRGLRRVCKPVIKYTPRLAPARRPAPSMAPPANEPVLEPEEDPAGPDQAALSPRRPVEPSPAAFARHVPASSPSRSVAAPRVPDALFR